MRLLFLFRHGPVAGSRTQDAIDLLLTLATFDQTVDVLLLDDAVWQLHADQHPGVLGHKNVSAVWGGLDFHGIQPPWVEEESLMERGMDTGSLLIPVRVLRRDDLGRFFRAYDRLVGD